MALSDARRDGSPFPILVQVVVCWDVVALAIGLAPARVSNPSTLTTVGAGLLIPAWLTLVTHTFPHGAWWHAPMNMAGLWALGRLAEPLMGTWRFLLTYLASGVVTGPVTLDTQTWHHESPCHDGQTPDGMAGRDHYDTR